MNIEVFARYNCNITAKARPKTQMRTTLLALCASAAYATSLDMDYMSALEKAIAKI